MHVRGQGIDKRTFWNNVKLGEITDERLARILTATFGNNICLCYQATMRDGKLVLEIYGDDVDDDFKQVLELVKK
jgi:hypothetical protein